VTEIVVRVATEQDLASPEVGGPAGEYRPQLAAVMNRGTGVVLVAEIDGTVVGADNWNNTVQFRSLAAPHSYSPLLAFGNDWTQAFHLSALADNEGWVREFLDRPLTRTVIEALLAD